MKLDTDLYEVLGVAKDADQDVIKKAYRKMAMQFHPDKNPGSKEAEEKFKVAAYAYEILGEPEKRAKYDRFGHAAFNQGAGARGFQDVDDIFSSFSDIFGDFFGGGRGRGRGRSSGPSRGSDLRYICEIQLKDVISGLEREIEFETDESCSTCEGTGAVKDSEVDTCKTCGGAGQVVTSQGFFSVAATCPSCRGQGKVVRNPCKACQGKGRTRQGRKIRVNVPAGVDSGTQLRVSGEGEGGFKGGPAGDLYVEIRVRDDERFERHGLDLLGKVQITYLQAILGSEIEVESLGGQVKIAVPPGTHSGSRLRIEQMGVPSLRGNGRGSLYYEVDVELPKKLGKEEERLLREIATSKGESVLEPKKGFFR